jgi:uncharacterized PurR-regulated membrane protein YhhQ (DUF165 family)
MLPIAFYLGSIILANFLVLQFGLVNHFGLTFPAGAYAIGITFTARDFVQRRYGKWKCWIWMGVAAAISALFAPKIAFASICAFLISEGIDWLVYTIMPGSFIKRVFTSNIIGIPLDSIVFVYLVFGFNWSAIWGQTIIKIICSLVILPLIYSLNHQQN